MDRLCGRVAIGVKNLDLFTLDILGKPNLIWILALVMIAGLLNFDRGLSYLESHEIGVRDSPLLSAFLFLTRIKTLLDTKAKYGFAQKPVPRMMLRRQRVTEGLLRERFSVRQPTDRAGGSRRSPRRCFSR